jgi:hypothetical protein
MLGLGMVASPASSEQEASAGGHKAIRYLEVDRAVDAGSPSSFRDQPDRISQGAVDLLKCGPDQ